MQEPVEVTLGGTDKVYYIPLEEMLQKLLTNELVLEEVCLYGNPIICTEIKLPCRVGMFICIKDICIWPIGKRYYPTCVCI